MPPVRIAVPESLRALAESAASRLDRQALHLVAAPATADDRLQRLWWERTRGRGGNQQDAADALRAASARTVAAVLDRRADAGLLAETDADWRSAWERIEPAAGVRACANLWIAGNGPGPQFAPQCGWTDPEPEAIAPASTALAAVSGRPAQLALVHFAVRRELSPAQQRLNETLGARAEAARVWLYSPLLYEQGRLDAVNWWRKLQAQLRPGGLPLICAPGTDRDEVAAAWCRAGGIWTGPLCAGGEAPFARLAVAATPDDVSATLQLLAAALGKIK